MLKTNEKIQTLDTNSSSYHYFLRRLKSLSDESWDFIESPEVILQCFWENIVRCYCYFNDYLDEEVFEQGSEHVEIARYINEINGNLNSSRFGIPNLEQGKESVTDAACLGEVLNFIRIAISRYSSNKSIATKYLTKACKNVVKAYSKAVATKEKAKNEKEKQNVKKEKLSKTVFNNVKKYLKEAIKEIDEQDPKYDLKFSEAFEELIKLAEMEVDEKSTSREKGLAGWYNRYGTTNFREYGEIVASFLYIEHYVKRTGFFGMGESRLKELAKIVKNNKTKLEKLLTMLTKE